MSITRIYDHDSELDMLHKNNLMELENWLHHLASLQTDIAHMLKILGNKYTKTTLLYQKLLGKKRENTAQLDIYFKYINQLKGSVECEDLQCDRYYVTQHEEFRRHYRYNLEKYFKVKEEFFNLILGNEHRVI